ncbi:ABC transporter permease [Vagococcus xieshaowenii]|uniref:ABC transporter permease n=1 Tax=Vagococcus xieshaowenii TaxID=2562451 RepID=A0AAJ5JL37_9ENTE|nr:ABC transporter permease [Vagococcus xieshaowenii]QCA28626.1 ABC transporter permease [Vagococcus xieshaowenii]TFZ40566.1 ABC transporter permease [Vagococcus xieshaowenii]
MNYIQRAWASVARKKGKSLILFAVIFILGNVIAGAIAIQQATGNVEKNIKKSLNATATLTVDYDKLEKVSEDFDYNDLKSQDIKVVNQIGELPQVEYMDYTMNAYEQTKKIKTITSDNMGGMSGLNYSGGNQPEISDIKKGIIQLKDGRVFSESDINEGKQVGLISTELAKANHLKIGDKMVIDQIQDFSWIDDSAESESEGMVEEPVLTKDNSVTVNLSIEIIGFFDLVDKSKEASKSDNEEDKFASEMQKIELQNTVYMPNKTIVKNTRQIAEAVKKANPSFYDNMYGDLSLDEIEKEYSFGQPFYMLKSPEDAESFREDAQALLTKYEKVLLSTDQYNEVAGPLNQMSKLANIVLWVAIGASIIIVTLVVLLFLRDRKHELGVYLSMGEKRRKVIGQIIIEVMLIGFVALSASVVSGNFVAKSVSNSMIAANVKKENETAQDDYKSEFEYQYLGGKSVSQEDVLDAYEVKLTPKFIGLFYAAGLGVIILSVLVPLLYIVRLNPKKILM